MLLGLGYGAVCSLCFNYYCMNQSQHIIGPSNTSPKSLIQVSSLFRAGLTDVRWFVSGAAEVLRVFEAGQDTTPPPAEPGVRVRRAKRRRLRVTRIMMSQSDEVGQEQLLGTVPVEMSRVFVR